MNDAVSWVSLPERLRVLSSDQHGRPVPLAWVITTHGVTRRPAWLTNAVNASKCWVCGRPLEATSGFVLSVPAFLVGLSEEPPAHVECARFPLHQTGWSSGLSVLWIGSNIRHLRSVSNKTLGIHILGAPAKVEWLSNGSPASRDVITKAIDAAAEALRELVAKDSYHGKTKRDVEARIRAAHRVAERTTRPQKGD